MAETYEYKSGAGSYSEGFDVRMTLKIPPTSEEHLAITGAIECLRAIYSEYKTPEKEGGE